MEVEQFEIDIKSMLFDDVDGSERRFSDDVYDMNHGRRGLALIFNHFQFEARLKLEERTGTNVDKEILKSTLTRLGFDAQVRQLSS
jgi:hypothetical protein